TLWYRVAGVPNSGEPFDLRAFEAGLPTPEKGRAGELIRAALQELDEQDKRITEKLTPPAPKEKGDAEAPREPPAAKEGGEPATAPSDANPELTYRNLLLEQAAAAGEKGWPKEDRELGAWLDAMFAGEWAGKLRRAAALPLGLVQDPRAVHFYTLSPDLHRAGLAATLLTGRALQLQARGG